MQALLRFSLAGVFHILCLHRPTGVQSLFADNPLEDFLFLSSHSGIDCKRCSCKAHQVHRVPALLPCQSSVPALHYVKKHSSATPTYFPLEPCTTVCVLVIFRNLPVSFGQVWKPAPGFRFRSWAASVLSYYVVSTTRISNTY